MWQPLGKLGVSEEKAPAPCRPTPSCEGRPTGMNDICATCPIGIERSVPAIVKAPSAKAMSAASASTKWQEKPCRVQGSHLLTHCKKDIFLRDVVVRLCECRG